MTGRRPLRRTAAAALALGAALCSLSLVPAAAGVASPVARAASAALALGPSVADPNDHLAQILRRSPAPEFRRFGSPGMAESADHVAGVLADAGYQVLRHDVPSDVYRVDYSPGHEPSVVRLGDGRSFRTESAFDLEGTTGPEGIECAVRAVADVRPGDCGFVPFPEISPEWKNLTADPMGAVRRIRDRGGVGAILQGDVARGALVALKLRQPLPTVVALADPADLVGQRVRLRVMGGVAPTTLRNVVAVRPPVDPSRGYVVVQGHLDAWFAGAADNAAGAAAVLSAAQELAPDRSGRGLLVALYDGEEWGLLGSKAFVADLGRPEGVAFGGCGPVVRLGDLVAVVNLDAPSAIASDALGLIPDPLDDLAHLVSYRVLVASAEPTVSALLAASMTSVGALGLPVPKEVAGPLNGGLSRTDGKWFDDAGIPVAWPVVGYPEYHTEADREPAVDAEDLRRVTAGAVSLVRSMATARIGRLPGANLAAPGAIRTPVPAACGAAQADADGAATIGDDPSVTPRPVPQRLPATGGDPLPSAVPLGLAALALLLWRGRRPPVSD